MTGYNCTCSRCGIAIRLLEPNAMGPTVRCSRCESLYGVPPEPRGVAEARPAAPARGVKPREHREARAEPTPQDDIPLDANLSGLALADDGWAEIQRRQRKKMLAIVLSALGALVLIIGIVVIASNAGSKNKKKGEVGTENRDFEVKDSEKETPEPPRVDELPGGVRPPRRGDEVEDDRPARPVRRLPEVEEDPPGRDKPPGR